MKFLTHIVSLTLLGGLLLKALPFSASIFIANTCGYHQFGTFSFILNTSNTITSFFIVGLAPFILNAVSSTDPSDENELISKINGILIISILLSIIVLFFGYLIGKINSSLFQTPASQLSIPLISSSLVLIQAVQSLNQGLGKYFRFFIFSCSIFIIVFSFILISIALNLPDLLYIFYSASLYLTSMVIFILFIFKNEKSYSINCIMIKLGTLTNLFKNQLSYAGYTSIWMLAIYLCNYEVALKYSSFDLALYNAGYQWFSLLLVLPTILGGVIIPHFSKLILSGNSFSLYDDIIKITLIYLLVIVFILSILFFSIPYILSLYSFPLIDESVHFFMFMLASGGFAVILTPILQYHLAKKRFTKLYSAGFLWSAVALLGVFLFSRTILQIAFWFCLSYFIVTFILLLDFGISLIKSRVFGKML